MAKSRIIKVLVLVAIFAAWRLIFSEGSTEPQLVHLTGTTMGPIPYSVKYLEENGLNYQIQVDSLLEAYNSVLSTYIPTSEISYFNKNDLITFDSPFFYPVLQASKEAYEKSGGAFDPTIGPLVNAWGFGPNKLSRMDSSKVDSLLAIVGFDKVVFDTRQATKLKGMYLDFSAIAKGNGIDVVAEFLKSRGVEDYMVEIGGEVTCRGVSDSEQPWKIGVQKPTMDGEVGDLFATVSMKDMALATSGNYRNYYIQDGKIIAHTISPFTGYPVTHNLLSASIFADNCTMADAYATACMVLGYEKSKELVESIDGLEAFFIYTDSIGDFQSYASVGISENIEVVK